ncbi:MAG: host-nuclease inhibitor Gam family protein [Terrimicrobiaceae bacterium]
MAPKKKVRIDTPKTRAGAEELLGEYAIAEAELRKQTAEMDGILSDIRTTYEQVTGELQKKLTALAEALEAWASLNTEEFGKKKSIEFMNGTLGYALNPASLVLRKGIRKDDAAQMCEDNGLAEFVRIKKEVDKETLMAQLTAKTLTEADLRLAGLEVKQDERFYIKTKNDDGK